MTASSTFAQFSLLYWKLLEAWEIVRPPNIMDFTFKWDVDVAFYVEPPKSLCHTLYLHFIYFVYYLYYGWVFKHCVKAQAIVVGHSTILLAPAMLENCISSFDTSGSSRRNHVWRLLESLVATKVGTRRVVLSCQVRDPYYKSFVMNLVLVGLVVTSRESCFTKVLLKGMMTKVLCKVLVSDESESYFL